MKYEDAVKAIAKNGDYVSADYYRMRTASSIALAIRDEPHIILMDVLIHGDNDTKQLLQMAMEQGYVIQRETEDGVPMLDVVDTENVAGAPYNFLSHVAMQIAYPALYWKYYDGEHVWTYSHDKMQALLKLCMSCMTDSRHPSDYYGEHEFKEETSEMPVTKTKAPNTAHKDWVRACQEHKKDISNQWAAYMELCNKRKASIVHWARWKEEQMEPLLEQIESINEQHDNAIDELSKGINEAFRRHADLKAAPKPQIIDYK